MQIDDSIRLTKFMHQNTTNTKHKQLAHTIFTTPNMTLGHVASLFETYNPPSGPAVTPTTPTVNAVTCRYCQGKDHKLSDCLKIKPISEKKRAEKSYSPSSARSRSGKRQRFPCAICDSMDHLSHLCPRSEDARWVRVRVSPPAGRLYHLTARTGSPLSGGAQQSEAGGVRTNFRWDINDGAFRDEVLSAVIEEAPILSLTHSSSGPMVLRFRCRCICCDVMSYSILYFCIPFPYLCCCHC